MISQLHDYKVGKTIGQGAFSKVKLATHISTGLKVAIKIIDKKEMAKKRDESKKHREEREKKKAAAIAKATQIPAAGSTMLSEDYKLESPKDFAKMVEELNLQKKKREDDREKEIQIQNSTNLVAKLETEVQLMMRLDHPNIVRIYQVLDSEDETYIVMEYASGGELIEHISRENYLSEIEGRKFFRQLISAIDHFHQANVVHRDLKLENVLLTEDKNLLITDFGLGRTFKAEGEDIMMTFCGTPNYAAIELVSGIPYIGVKTDIWAMGVILYVMMAGFPPFKGSSVQQVYNNIKQLKYKIPKHFSTELVDLLELILVRDPAHRIDMDGLRSNKWVNMDYPELPQRIPPIFTSVDDSVSLSKLVSSISKDGNMTVITIHKPVNSKDLSRIKSVEQLSSPTTGARQSVIDSFNSPGSATSPVTSLQSTRDENEDQLPELPGKKGRSASVVRSSTSSNGDFGNRRRFFSVTPIKTNMEEEEKVLRMSMVGMRSPENSAGPYASNFSSVSTPLSPTAPQLPLPLETLIEPSDKDIQEWHSIHKPPKSIRSMQITFRKGMTSNQEPAVLFQDLHRSIIVLKSKLPNAFTFCRESEYYILKCTYQYTEESPLKFEVEICRIWGTSLHGLRSRRVVGDAIVYQTCVTQLVAVLGW